LGEGSAEDKAQPKPRIRSEADLTPSLGHSDPFFQKGRKFRRAYYPLVQRGHKKKYPRGFPAKKKKTGQKKKKKTRKAVRVKQRPVVLKIKEKSGSHESKNCSQGEGSG